MVKAFTMGYGSPVVTIECASFASVVGHGYDKATQRAVLDPPPAEPHKHAAAPPDDDG